MKKLLYICERGEFAGSFQSQKGQKPVASFREVRVDC